MGIKDMRLPTISFLPNKSTATAKDTDNVFKTLNSVYFDSANDAISLSSDYDDKDENKAKRRDHEDEDEDEDIESIIRGAHSESRLFFDPSTAKSIALDEDEGMMMMNKYSPLKESVAMAMESEDPYMDFRVSMEEMVESNGMIKKDWGHLEELLAWYLRVNAKNNHAYIVAAFVDLLLKISSSPPPNSDDLHQIDQGSPNSGCTTTTTTTTTSTRSSSCASGELQQLGLNSSSSITSTSCFSPSASSSLSPHHNHHQRTDREDKLS